ncbi:MAG TPA: O-antigen ligase family protein, partial [Pyrinomonadaceae bacterium]|nr:O-antigen ligase family protein [Pyrinomonadaceae bacterium]
MAGIIERFDRLAGIHDSGFIVKWLERTAFVFLFLMVVMSPHSIAASQASWILGMLFTAARLAFKPRVKFRFTTLHIALWAIFLWAVVSSLFSYEPAISLDKLRGVSLFLVFFLVYLNLRRLPALYFLAFALIFSCMVNVVWVIGQRFAGRGVEVYGVSANGPLGKLEIIDGTTLLTANGKKINTPDELISILEQKSSVKLTIYQYEFYLERELSRDDLLPGANANERLGIGSWSRSYNWRAQGFFGHFTTYAEALQLIASLLFGLIVATLVRRQNEDDTVVIRNRILKVITSTPLLIVLLASILIALLLTVTRASQLAFMVSAFSIIIVSGSRKLLVAAGLIAIPVVLGGLLFLQQTRNVGFIDTSDESTRYRIVMWHDGMRLSTTNAHNFIFGLGMDSIKKHWQEWGMFEGGQLPLSHFHSTPIQLLVERGLPALLIWLAVLFLYGKTLWRALR